MTKKAADQGYTSENGGLWIQVGGSNMPVEYFGCKDLGDFTVPDGGVEYSYCTAPDGTWEIVTQRHTVPDPITLSLQSLLYKARDYLEKVTEPFALYIFQRRCGRADIWGEYDRVYAITDITRTGRTYSNLVKRSDHADSGLSVDMTAVGFYNITEMDVTRMTTTATHAFNGIAFNKDRRAIGTCGDALEPGQDGVAVGDSAVAPAFADVVVTDDSGDTWTQVAANPFAAGANVMSVVRFPIGANTYRIIAGMEAPVGAQGMVAYSDDEGATWVTVNIGGAAAGHGASYGGGLFALDNRHIWLAGAAGYIYFSADGGETWTAQEAGVLTATAYKTIHFADKYFGVAGAAAGVVSITNDGGENWEAATVSGPGDVQASTRLDRNRIWVGDDDGKLWYSRDEGVTWTQRGGWAGSGTGQVRGMSWVDEYVGYLLHNTAGPVGTVLRTFNGGTDWEALTTPTNTGLNHIYAIDEHLAYAVGEAQGGTGVILKIAAAN